jgi:hypothetical protein
MTILLAILLYCAVIIIAPTIIYVYLLIKVLKKRGLMK